METKHHCTIHQGEGTFDLLPGQRCKKCRPKENKEECHCSRTSRWHTIDTNYQNHSIDRCWSAPQTPDSMDWEKEFNEMRRGKGQFIVPTEVVKSFVREKIALAQSSGRREERQFILNILDGIDKADEEMGNRGGGTKAIRHALESRIID